MLIPCDNCGTILSKRPSIVRDTNFCNHTCYGEYLKGKKKGTNKVIFNCKYCDTVLYKWPSQVRQFCNRECAGKFRSIEITQEGHPNWKGGISKERSSPEYKTWRLSVYERDEFTCQKCEQVGGELNAHHILSFARYEDARYKISNGATLCRECHNKFHSTYTKTQFTEDDFVEYMQ